MGIKVLELKTLTGPFVEQTWDFDTPELRWMLAYWQEKRGKRARPRWRDIDLPKIYRYAPMIVVKDAINDGEDYLIRFWGTQIAAWLQFDGTGKCMSSYFPKAHLRNMLESHRQALHQGAPVRRWGICQYPDRGHMAFETITLGLDDDAEKPAHVITLSMFKAVDPK